MNLPREFRPALRHLAQSPGFAATALITLTLGIAASTAIFSLLHAVLLSPLPFPEPERLLWIRSRHTEQGSTGVASATFADLAAGNRSFASLAMRTWSESVLTQAGTPQKLDVVQATAGYFETLATPPLLGRTWTAAEAQPGASPVVVLSQDFFARQFGGDPSSLGKTIVLNDVPHQVVGVMPASFRDPLNPSTGPVYVPLPMTEARARDRGGRYWGVIGRLKPGVTPAEANAELATVARHLERDHGDLYRNWTLEAQDLRDRIVQNVRSGILLATGAAACLLLITCANVAGLALLRALARRRELAIRTALGASHAQLVRQLLMENILLVLTAGALGVTTGRLALHALIASLPEGWLPRAEEISLNPAVLAVAFVLTLGTTLVTGLAPALTAARTDAQEALSEGSRGSRGPQSRRLQTGLVVAEIALATVLLVGAGLLGRSFFRVLQRDPGMNTAQVVAFTLPVTSRRHNTMEKRADLLQRIEAEVAAAPGVAAVGLTQTPPFRSGWVRSPFLAVGESAVGSESAITCYSDSVSVEYFRTVGVSLLAGRNFSALDRADSPHVIIVSQATARRFFGALDPLGRSLSRPGGGDTARIVGVVSDTRRDGLAAEMPLQVYRPLAQHASIYATLMVRSELPAANVVRAVQAAVWRVDADMPLADIAPLDAFVSETVIQPRLHLRLFALFAGTALLLCAVGLHGIVAYSVAQRHREFGIRSALGAAPRTVLLQVLRESSRIVALGLLLGLGTALFGAEVLQSMVYDISLYDPAVLGGATLLLGTVALLACLQPARRATQVDPVVALRAE